MSILSTVTEAESKVVDAVRDLQAPVVAYVQKGVDLAAERLPRVAYPAGLPSPGEVVDSQYQFLTALLAAEYDLVKAVTATIEPLVEAPRPGQPKATASKASKAA